MLPRKKIQEPWLGWLADGTKTFEGRLNRGLWGSLRPGDRFVAYSAEREVTLVVVQRKLFADFGAAWRALGPLLIPTACGVTSAEGARAVYAEWYGPRDVAQTGVVVLGLCALKLRATGRRRA